MSLIQGLAVIRIQAEPHIRAPAGGDFAEPVRVGERLARESDDVRLTARENGLGLFEAVDSARSDHRSRESRRTHGGANLRRGAQISSKRALTEQTGYEAIVSNAQQRTARHIADARRFNDN